MKLYASLDPETRQERITDKPPEPEQWICDFCSKHEAFKAYPNRATVLMASGMADEGGWIACRTCAELIDAGKWDELRKRSVDAFLEYHPEVPEDARPFLEAHVQQAHLGFRANRVQEDQA
jgi:hypothetical protein